MFFFCVCEVNLGIYTRPLSRVSLGNFGLASQKQSMQVHHKTLVMQLTHVNQKERHLMPAKKKKKSLETNPPRSLLTGFD